MPSCSLINGLPGNMLAISDRGLHYGDGLFETLAVRDGVCQFWDRHLRRLRVGCERLRIPPPDNDQLEFEATKLTATIQRGVLKIIITRGTGGRGYRMPELPQPSRILICKDWPEYPPDNIQQGICVRICSQILGSNSTLAGIKHLNRLEQILARAEWDDPDIGEGLLLNEGGLVIEGTCSNLFMVQSGRLITPRLDRSGVAGIMREVVMELADSAGIDCSELTLPVGELFSADELFITNSLIGIWPIRKLSHWEKMPGPVTCSLQTALSKL